MADFGTIFLSCCSQVQMTYLCISGGQKVHSCWLHCYCYSYDCENAVKARSSLKCLKLVRFKYLEHRVQDLHQIYKDLLMNFLKILMMDIRFGAVKPVKLIMASGFGVHDHFVQSYLPNPMTYGHGTYTVGYSKDWKVDIPIRYEAVSMWNELCFIILVHMGIICVTISCMTPSLLWTWIMQGGFVPLKFLPMHVI